jgi:hypothetical protein
LIYVYSSVVIISCGEDYVGVVKDDDKPSSSLTSSQNSDVVVTILAKASWIDDEAVQQLHYVAKTLPGMKIVAGMPDLHAGRTFPVGASFVTAGRIYPPLSGTDIG